MEGPKEKKPSSGSKRAGAERPTMSISLTLFVDQIAYLDEIAGESYQSNTARLILDLAIATEKEGMKKRKKTT